MITSKVMSALAVGAFLAGAMPALSKTETLVSTRPAPEAVCRASSPQSGAVWGYQPYKIARAPAMDSETSSVWGSHPYASSSWGFC
jgi:hypothetical protein